MTINPNTQHNELCTHLPPPSQSRLIVLCRTWPCALFKHLTHFTQHGTHNTTLTTLTLTRNLVQPSQAKPHFPFYKITIIIAIFIAAWCWSSAATDAAIRHIRVTALQGPFFPTYTFESNIIVRDVDFEKWVTNLHKNL